MKVAWDTFTSLRISHPEGPGNWRCLPNPRPDWYPIRGNYYNSHYPVPPPPFWAQLLI